MGSQEEGEGVEEGCGVEERAQDMCYIWPLLVGLNVECRLWAHAFDTRSPTGALVFKDVELWEVEAC